MNQNCDIPDVQICSTCAQVLPVTEFRLRRKTGGIRMTECRPCRNAKDRKRRQRKHQYSIGWKLQKGASAIARETDPQRAMALLDLMVSGIGGPEVFARSWHAEVQRLRSTRKLSTRLFRFYEAVVSLLTHLEGQKREEQGEASTEDLEAILSDEVRRQIELDPTIVLHAAQSLGCRVEWPDPDTRNNVAKGVA